MPHGRRRSWRRCRNNEAPLYNNEEAPLSAKSQVSETTMPLRLRIAGQNAQTAVRTIDAPLTRLGRSAECDISFDPAQYPQVSSVHAQIEQTSIGPVLTPLSKSNKTLL